MVTWRMNITQEPATNTVPPFPFFVENPVDLHPNELPTDKNNINSEPLKSQTSEIPFPSHFHIDTNPLPERCQFTFSDGRQCAMARSDIHPSLCRFHSEREDQLFGDPAPGGNVVGAALDLPELHSACRDLTTAAGVNRALAQVFRLLAQRRISRQEAATFGHLAQLLLRTISAMRVLAGESPAANVYLSAGESHGHQELSPVHKAELRGVDKNHQECRVPGIPEATAGLSPVNNVSAPADQESPEIEQPSHAVLERQKCVSSPAATNGRKPARAAAISSS